MVGPVKTVSFFVFLVAFFVFIFHVSYLVIYDNSILKTLTISSSYNGVPKNNGSVLQRIVHFYDSLLGETNEEDIYKIKPFFENPSWFYDKLTQQGNYKSNKFTKDIEQKNNITNKKILFWNPAGRPYYKNMQYLEPGSMNWFRDVARCPVWQCEVSASWENSSNTIPVEDYDALLFYDTLWADANQLPAKRSPHQYYIWHNREAPGYHAPVRKWNALNSVFNWTVTYRWDSDIVFPYGYFRPLLRNDSIGRTTQKKNYAEGKSKMAIWFVTNCQAKNGRSEYVQRLQNHISVDIYGSCGPFKCARENLSGCREMMERDYKFVIAFENSLCWDYVTEKLFYNLKYNIVPIVMDLHGNYARFAPAGSYINALDFPSVKELADYLKVLDGNDTLYNQYFRWKEQYVVSDFFSNQKQNGTSVVIDQLCSICSKLHDPSRTINNIVKNLTKWWNDDAKCKMIQFPSENATTWIAKDYHPPHLK